MIDGRLLVITHVVEDDTEVDVGKELACNICDLLVLVMILNSIFVVLGVISFTKLHVVNANAVVRKGLAMNVANGLADLKEAFVLLDSLLVFAKVIIQNTSRVVRTAFISRLSGSFASKGKDVVVLKSLLGCDSVIRIRVGHVEPAVVFKNAGCQFLSLVVEALFADNVFFSLRCIEVDGEFDALGLVHAQR